MIEARESFPAPREHDCANGCCKAGDVGLFSERVRSQYGAMDAAAPSNEIKRAKRIGPDLQHIPKITVERL